MFDDLIEKPIAQLVMRSGPTPGIIIPLEKEEMIIGRDKGNDIFIDEVELSRRHARLTIKGGDYHIEDLGTTNGTFVNEQRIFSPYTLKSGDIILFGEAVVLKYEILDSSVIVGTNNIINNYFFVGDNIHGFGFW